MARTVNRTIKTRTIKALFINVDTLETTELEFTSEIHTPVSKVINTSTPPGLRCLKVVSEEKSSRTYTMPEDKFIELATIKSTTTKDSEES